MPKKEGTVTPKAIETPSVGKVLLFKTDVEDDSWRPAIVTKVNADATVDLSVMVHPDDIPPKYGTRLQADSYAGYYAQRVFAGSGIGNWKWPR